MKFLRNIAAAFSLYSRIPVPRFQWKEDDLKYHLVFLPWVGAIIGALEILIVAFADFAYLPDLATVVLLALAPLVVSGGFHLDGFMDVQDALRSYKPREEKLQILKDPHIGAFAVIGLAKLALVWLAALAVVVDSGSFPPLYAVATIFFGARAVAGVLALATPPARKDGMLVMETSGASRAAIVALIAEAALGFGSIAAFDVTLSVLCAVFAALYVIRYRRKCLREFGGATGDLIGCFVVKCETVLLAVVAAATVWADL